jgi:hypothetical protein
MKVLVTIKFVFHGQLGKWVGGKDLILYTIGKIEWTAPYTLRWSLPEKLFPHCDERTLHHGQYGSWRRSEGWSLLVMKTCLR